MLRFQPLAQRLLELVHRAPGIGEVVLYASGSSARQTEITRDRPVDAVVMAIVDSWDVGGEERYHKGREEGRTG